MAAKDFQSAIVFLERSAEAFPHFKTLELLGECLLRTGQVEGALLSLRKAVEPGNRPYRSLYLLGQALSELGKRDEAIGCLTQAIEIKPDYKSARNLLNTLQNRQR